MKSFRDTPAPHGGAATMHDAPTPGKRSLSEHLPVQCAGEGVAIESAVVHASAERGIATPASALPHAARIQQLFGHHDISGIKAHTGADAAASTRAMGAAAYATGDHVVLGSRSDLHTVAHEAAHVVQQRGGVQLKGGVGEAGDAHERHADAVADAVVAGRSAEALLDEHTGGQPSQAGAASVQRAVQMLPEEQRARLRQHIIRELQQFGIPVTPEFIGQVMNVADPQPYATADDGIMDNGATSLQDACNAASMAISRFVLLQLPNRETVADHDNAMGIDRFPEQAMNVEPPAPVAVVDAAPSASPALSAAPAPRRRDSGRFGLLGSAMQIRSEGQTRDTRAQREAAPHVESEQERRARERREGGAAIAPQLRGAQVNFVGHRVDVHIREGSAGIDNRGVVDLIHAAANVESQGIGNDGAPTYVITYHSGTIVFSTRDRGATVNVFHVGPGAPQ